MSTSFTISNVVQLPFTQALKATRAALAEQGFGILTEIDLASTLNQKVGADLAPQVILGACRPALAHQAIQSDPAIATLLPCNVVVRATGPASCIVEAFDPDAMTRLADNEALAIVANDARTRLTAALATLA